MGRYDLSRIEPSHVSFNPWEASGNVKALMRGLYPLLIPHYITQVLISLDEQQIITGHIFLLCKNCTLLVFLSNLLLQNSLLIYSLLSQCGLNYVTTIA